MKTHFLTLVAVGGLTGVVESQAQLSASFGPIYRPPLSGGQSDSDSVNLDVSSDPATLQLNVSLSIVGGSYIRPLSGTPRESSPGVPNVETYTITFADLVVKVASADGMIDVPFTDPVEVHLGQCQFTVSLTMPAGTQGDPYSNITFPPPATVPLTVNKSALLPLQPGGTSPQQFTVTFLGGAFNLASVTGGKGVDGSAIVGEINGVLAVPEPGQFALFAGLGLVAFAGWRRTSRI